MKQVVIASNNAGKLREIARILEPLGLTAQPQANFAVPECPEPHVTFVENCIAKARHASAHTTTDGTVHLDLPDGPDGPVPSSN